MRFKEIKLLPSSWILDVVHYPHKDDEEKLSHWMHIRYGLPLIDLERDPTNSNACHKIESASKSELKGERRILVVLKTLDDPGLIVHELLHALWYYSSCSGTEMSYETQEWQALHLEYTFNEVINPKTWQVIPLKSIQLPKTVACTSPSS